MAAVPALYKKWTAAVKQANLSEQDFVNICESVGPKNTRAWTELEARLQLERADDITVMDQFDIVDKAGTRYVFTSVS